MFLKIIGDLKIEFECPKNLWVTFEFVFLSLFFNGSRTFCHERKADD